MIEYCDFYSKNCSVPAQWWRYFSRPLLAGWAGQLALERCLGAAEADNDGIVIRPVRRLAAAAGGVCGGRGGRGAAAPPAARASLPAAWPAWPAWPPWPRGWGGRDAGWPPASGLARLFPELLSAKTISLPLKGAAGGQAAPTGRRPGLDAEGIDADRAFASQFAATASHSQPQADVGSHLRCPRSPRHTATPRTSERIKAFQNQFSSVRLSYRQVWRRGGRGWGRGEIQTGSGRGRRRGGGAPRAGRRAPLRAPFQFLFILIHQAWAGVARPWARRRGVGVPRRPDGLAWAIRQAIIAATTDTATNTGHGGQARWRGGAWRGQRTARGAVAVARSGSQ